MLIKRETQNTDIDAGGTWEGEPSVSSGWKAFWQEIKRLAALSRERKAALLAGKGELQIAT